MGKPKIRKETRDEAARRIFKEKKEKGEISFGRKLGRVKAKNQYVKDLINGRYFLARTNMIAEQLQKKDIKESIDGCPKTEEFMRAEYAHQKMQAIVSMRSSFFAKEELMKEHKLTQEDLFDLEKDYYDGKIVREAYDEEYKKQTKAQFVDTQ